MAALSLMPEFDALRGKLLRVSSLYLDIDSTSKVGITQFREEPI